MPRYFCTVWSQPTALADQRAPHVFKNAEHLGLAARHEIRDLFEVFINQLREYRLIHRAEKRSYILVVQLLLALKERRQILKILKILRAFDV